MKKIFIKNKKPDTKRLLSFGFSSAEDSLEYREEILDGQMSLRALVNPDGELFTEVTDLLSGDEYVLHNIPDAVGEFVGKVRDEHDRVVERIIASCYENDIFKQEQTKMLIEYVRQKYGDTPEFLWEKFDNNAVFRRKDTGKWYAAVLTVSKNKLGFDSGEEVEIIALRISPDEIDALVDNKTYFRGWHMNKKHWYTMILDGSVPFEELCERVDRSYSLK